MDFMMIIGCFFTVSIVTKSIKYIKDHNNKFTKDNKKPNPESNFLHNLNERIAERIIDYSYYVQTNSNVISLQEPYYLQYNLEKPYDNSLKEDLKVIDLKDCQYCGNLNAEKARFCTYCGIKLKF